MILLIPIPIIHPISSQLEEIETQIRKENNILLNQQTPKSSIQSS